MSEQLHTPEPWNVRELGDDCFITAAIEPGMAYGLEIMGDDYTGYGDEERKKADARRIVACVNACAGINTEALEEFSKTDRFDGLTYDDLTKQREELLAALERLTFAAMRRDNTMGDQCCLIEVKAELASAASHASATIARVKDNHIADASKMVIETAVPAIVSYPTGSLGEPVESEGSQA